MGVGGARFTIVNNCSESIWPAFLSQINETGLEGTLYELHEGNSTVLQAPTRWSGRLWGRTGCTFGFNVNSISGFCATGDCGSSQLQCQTNATATTLVEFTLGSSSRDYYDVSLVNGYNLPLLVKPSNSGSGQCASAGCPDDLNQICPLELRTEGGRACRSMCQVFSTSEYCCTGANASPSSCRPTNYSKVFKKACPQAYSYPYDDATSMFTCPTGADYVITFCPISSAQTGKGMPAARSPDYAPPPTITGSDSGKNPAELIIIIVVSSIAGFIIGCIIIYYFLKRPHSASQDIDEIISQHGPLAPKRYKYSKIKKMTKSVSDKLGQGAYGSVYKGMLPDGSLVAVKVLNPIETDSNGEEFINEVVSISRTSHVNIVSLLGFCYEGNNRALVYEYMVNKSLDKFINNNGSANTDSHLDLEILYKIAVGVAKGLEYLHTGCKTRIVHFDIKPQNILLDEDFCPKISDFGLAKLCKKQSILSVLGTRGTIGFIAPEMIYGNFGGVSHKSDVYSYGMMVLDMVGARKTDETEVVRSSESYFPDKIYEQVIIDVTKKLDDAMFEKGEETRTKMFLIGFWCIQTTPSDRPSMSKVVEMFEGSLHSIQIPPKPVLFSPHHNREISSSFSAHLEIENSVQD